jgi:hypothetical protein
MRQQVPQSIDQIFQSESGGSGTGCELACHLSELAFALALGRFLFEFLVRNKCSRALMGLEQSAQFEFAVSAHNGVGIDGQIDGKLADGGQLISGAQGAGRNAGMRLIDDLAVNRNAAAEIERELEGAAGLGFVPHAH